MPQTVDDNLAIDLGVLSAEPAEEYHAKAGEYLSSSMLRNFLVSPDYFRRKELGQTKETESSGLLLGTATHVRILEGKDAYQTQFAIGGPINPRTDKPFGMNTQAWARWAAEQGRPVLSEDMADKVETMTRSVSLNEEAVELLLWGRSEGVARAQYHGMPCQIRIDWLHPEHGIVDLKTTGGSLNRLHYLIREYGYLQQLAFYQSVLAEVIGEHVPAHLVIVEANEPHRCQVVSFGPESMDRARRRNEAAMDRVQECRKTNVWPTALEPRVILDFP